jgi:hypothetical protein
VLLSQVYDLKMIVSDWHMQHTPYRTFQPSAIDAITEEKGRYSLQVVSSRFLWVAEGRGQTTDDRRQMTDDR